MTTSKKQPPRLWKNYRNDICTIDVWALVLCAMAVLWPVDVWAAGGETSAASLGDIICNIRLNIAGFVPFFSALAYVGGAVMAINGVMLLKKHAEKPDDSQIVKASVQLLAGGALASFPAMAAVIQNTIFKSVSGGGTMGCSAPKISGSASGLDIMMQNFVNNIYSPMFSTLAVLAFVMGAFFIFRGLVKASKIGGNDPRAAATHSIVVNLVVGAVLMTIGGMFPVLQQSLFGSIDT